MSTGVTIWYLEMHDPGELIHGTPPSEIPQLKKMHTPLWQMNRDLYTWVGKDWKWHDKASWTENDWKQYAEREVLQTWIAWSDEKIAGYFELEFQPDNTVQLIYFGLMPDFIGKRIGGWLLEQAVKAAWNQGAKRVWVHTCSDDHPAALPNYQARGFRLFKTEIKE